MRNIESEESLFILKGSPVLKEGSHIHWRQLCHARKSGDWIFELKGKGELIKAREYEIYIDYPLLTEKDIQSDHSIPNNPQLKWGPFKPVTFEVFSN